MLSPGPSSSHEDEEIETIRSALYGLDPDGGLMASVIRATYDQLLDGRRTGRWDYAKLHKTEKTFMGTLVEINIFKEFQLAEGEVADYAINGIEVDCKYAKNIGGWEIGPELVGYICLVVTADDLKGTWSAGLVRASEEHLRITENRDRKRKLNQAGVASISWLWGDSGRLSPNQLLHMDPARRERIMSATGRIKGRSGQARINQLFREVQEVIVRRVTIETVGHGLEDPLKRVRSNGGARDRLQKEGILILGHQDNDPLVARSLGLSVPKKGQFIAAQVVPVAQPQEGRATAEIAGRHWAIARDGEISVQAPAIPRKKHPENPVDA